MLPAIHIKVISLKYPCNACQIVYQAVKEVIEKVLPAFEGAKVEYLELENLKGIHEITGLEVEKFPAVLINDEQMTAGSIITKRQLEEMLREVGE